MRFQWKETILRYLRPILAADTRVGDHPTTYKREEPQPQKRKKQAREKYKNKHFEGQLLATWGGVNDYGTATTRVACLLRFEQQKKRRAK